MFPFVEVENVKRMLYILERKICEMQEDILAIRFVVMNLLEDEEANLPKPEDFEPPLGTRT